MAYPRVTLIRGALLVGAVLLVAGAVHPSAQAPGHLQRTRRADRLRQLHIVPSSGRSGARFRS